MCLEFLKARNGSPLLSSGHQLGEEHLELLDLPFLIKKKNSLNTETILRVNLPPNSLLPIIKSFSMTSPSETKLPVVNTLYSPTFTNSPDFTWPSYSQTALSLHQNKQTLRNQLPTRTTTNPKFVTNSTSEPARTQKLTASANICAKTVIDPVIPKEVAHLVLHEIHGLQPKYLCHNLWKDTPSLSPTTAEWSKTACPLLIHLLKRF